MLTSNHTFCLANLSALVMCPFGHWNQLVKFGFVQVKTNVGISNVAVNNVQVLLSGSYFATWHLKDKLYFIQFTLNRNYDSKTDKKSSRIP